MVVDLHVLGVWYSDTNLYVYHFSGVSTVFYKANERVERSGPG